MKNYTILICLLVTACSDVGAIETSTPEIKLEQSSKMIQAGRPLMADKLIGEALQIYKENNNSLGIAKAHFAYGNLYKNVLLRQYVTIYDSTFEKSISHFIKSKEWYKKAKNEMGVVKSLNGIGIAYAKKGNFKTACKNFLESLQTYKTGKAKGTITNEHEIILPGHSDFGGVIRHMIKKANCNN